MERRQFVRKLSLGGVVAAVGVAATALGANAKQSPPHGRPFRWLLRMIRKLRRDVDALGEEVDQLSQGTFEQLRVVDPDPDAPDQLFFGPTDATSLGTDPKLAGLIERDPTGFRILGSGDQGFRLLFGPTDLCTIEVDPPSNLTNQVDRLSGLMLRDPGGVRVLNPDPDGSLTLSFGPTDDCTIGVDPPNDANRLGGLMLRDPEGIRILNPEPKSDAALFFGETDLCRIQANPNDGLIFVDPRGVTVQNPVAGESSTLGFGGPDSECRISAGPGSPTGGPGGMLLQDPLSFQFQNPQLANGAVVSVDGKVLANEFVQTSSAALKENVVPLSDALERIDRLQGVRFDWKAEQGGKPSIGFIAEDVAEVFPELVTHEEDGSVRGLAYGNVVAVAVEGIKAQQAQIQQLESEKTSLQAEVAELRDGLAEVSAQMQRLSSRTS